MTFVWIGKDHIWDNWRSKIEVTQVCFFKSDLFSSIYYRSSALQNSFWMLLGPQTGRLACFGHRSHRLAKGDKVDLVKTQDYVGGWDYVAVPSEAESMLDHFPSKWCERSIGLGPLTGVVNGHPESPRTVRNRGYEWTPRICGAGGCCCSCRCCSSRGVFREGWKLELKWRLAGQLSI